jgi:hypothetical protein
MQTGIVGARQVGVNITRQCQRQPTCTATPVTATLQAGPGQSPGIACFMPTALIRSTSTNTLTGARRAGHRRRDRPSPAAARPRSEREHGADLDACEGHVGGKHA